VILLELTFSTALKGGRWLIIETESDGLIVNTIIDGEHRCTDAMKLSDALKISALVMSKERIPYSNLLVEATMDPGVSDLIYRMLEPLQKAIH
jgi:hypothetical protein